MFVTSFIEIPPIREEISPNPAKEVLTENGRTGGIFETIH